MSKPVVLGTLGAVIAVSVSAYLLWPNSNEGDDGEDILPKDIILELFTTLTQEMPGRMAPLMQQIQQVKQQNPQINEAELQKVVLQNFDNMLKAAQEKVAYVLFPVLLFFQKSKLAYLVGNSCLPKKTLKKVRPIDLPCII